MRAVNVVTSVKPMSIANPAMSVISLVRLYYDYCNRYGLKVFMDTISGNVILMCMNYGVVMQRC